MSPFLTLKTINRIEPGTMLDVGTRDSWIAAQFAKAGYGVDAIDPCKPPAGTDLDRINFQQTTLETFTPSKSYDLVVASMVSQFVSYSIPEFVGRLKSLTKPDGLIYVTLLGEEDEWAANPKNKALTFQEAEAIISKHELMPLIRSIDWIQGFLYSGEPKFWHRFTFVLSQERTP
ncbi:MAG: methyltransferase domain-containing protein [Alphaproteobacteria bacterium]|nr:methyltransferase domain-containing protein [Alphaproteobacteria bacterium]